jgi:hypothetical protein
LVSADDYSVTFYAFMGAGTYVPDRFELTWDTNTNSIIQRKWTGSGTAGSFSWAGTPTTTTLLTDVRPTFVSGQSGPRGPVFKYFLGGSATPRTTPLNLADLAATSEVDIQFMTYPQGRGATGTSTTLQSQVFSRTADPNGLSGSTAPECA